jgi:hypothetical protein
VAENSNQTPSNGVTQSEPRKSLREAAEAAWDSVVEEAPEEDGEPAVDDQAQPRDNLGRFVSKPEEAKPGEAEPDGSQPREDEQQAPDGAPSVPPAPEGSSREPPQHWDAKAREMYARLPEEAKDFLLERVRSTEADYTRKVQAAATAVQFTNALGPTFQDPQIAASLQQAGITPYDAIQQWAAFHKWYLTNPAGMIEELRNRAGLNSAANGQTKNPLGLPDDVLADPAVAKFADYIGATQSEMQALRGTLNQIVQSGIDQQNAQAVAQSRWTIEQFADAKDQQGNPLHPFLDHPEVIGELIEKFRVDPNRDLQQTYDRAVWAVPELRKLMLDAERNSAQRQQSNERARLAVRGNVRGLTSPVTKPPSETGPQGLRGTIEAAADEVGF